MPMPGIAEARGRLDATAVVLVAAVQDAAGEPEVAYRQLSRAIVVDGCAKLSEGEAMN